jgi:O-antigen/teichoic acid export membrane protein
LSKFRHIRTLALYIAIPALSAVTPLIVLPALTSSYGAAGLAAISIGTSLGASAAVIAELGWSVLGPQVVARAGASERRRLYQSAFATRLTALVIIGPLASAIAYALSPQFKFASASIALALSLSAMSPSWFLIGVNRPLVILSAEALPRVIFSAAAAAGLIAGAPLEWYGYAVGLAAIATWLLTAAISKQAFWPSLQDFREGRAVITRQFPLTLGRIVSVLYTSLPVTIVAIVAPGATASFAAIDRLMRMASALLGAIPTRLQSWVGSDRSTDHRRSRQALLMNVLLGLVSGIAFAILAPTVARFVFSGVVDLGFDLTSLAGTVLFAICASRGFGLSLVAEGKANWIAAANIGAAVVGVASIYLLAGKWGTDGALIGELAAEIVGLSIQAMILFVGHRWINPKNQLPD